MPEQLAEDCSFLWMWKFGEKPGVARSQDIESENEVNTEENRKEEIREKESGPQVLHDDIISASVFSCTRT